MPIPENPQSRSEQYLNAIATGDNSGLPEFPQSRMEQYLEVIAQNGGGGSSGGGVLVVHGALSTSEGTITLDKTWTEIVSAEFAVISVASEGWHFFLHINSIIHDGTAYGVGACGDPSNSKELTFFEFVTDSPDGYPAANIT